MIEIYDDHMVHGDGVKHQRFVDLQSRGFKPEYQQTGIVGSSNDPHGYLVAEITVLTVEFEDADVSNDTITTYLCGCDDFWYRASADIETDATPDSIGQCKHIRKSFRHVKAQADENQTEL